MAETVQIGEIANKLSEDIFQFFRWNSHPRRDQNFPCHNENHVSGGRNPKPKKTHPCDVLFFYEDPYLGRRIYLKTDLKSYSKDSIGTVKIRAAIESLSSSVECARESPEWRNLYSVTDDSQYELRGLLFVHNHDNLYIEEFNKQIEKTDLSTIPIAANVYVHFLGPEDIRRLYTIANDIIRLKYFRALPEDYSFYYPDLVMWRRHGELLNQAATIESLTAPYFILVYEGAEKRMPGFVIYYNRPGSSASEFEYFLDSLSRYQMLEQEREIRIRMVGNPTDENFLSYFAAAKSRYVKAWGLDPRRQEILDAIKIEKVTAVATTYDAPSMGWRE